MKTRYDDLRRTLFAALLLPLMPGCEQAQQSGYQGYAEGDYLYLAAPQAGYLETLAADRGSRVTKGEPVFSVSAEPELFDMEEAVAQAEARKADVANLELPRRQAEIETKEAELKKAQADLAYAEAQLRRMQALVEKGFVSREGLDGARADRDRNAAEVEAVREQLALYRIALGREKEIRAAEAGLKAAEAKTEQKRWLVGKKTVSAPAEGEVTETYYRPGEWVPAARPVLSFLPDERRFIRFFVPETALAGLRLGQTVSADCDGCEKPVEAKITFISSRVEYTPPVIYSREERAKLVYRVEATPAAEDAARLHPGLPMTINVKDKTS